MLMILTATRPSAVAAREPRGFTLVELMIAMAVSLIVALAAVGFVVSLIKANSENLKVTRLTQELRSLSEVMGREIRRARYVADPVGLIGAGNPAAHDEIAINGVLTNSLLNYCAPQTIPSGANCIVLRYDDPPPNSVSRSRSIWLNGTSIVLNPIGTACSGGTVISSAEVRITGLCFERTDSKVNMVVAGELANSPPGLAGVSRTFRQTIYVRSGEVN